ncbi:MAG: 16S rRNA (cytosine(1402)-N(4))-methyltransferase RsmH [Clostridiales bacterium]|nr:16S rRNA (cytosine(1402)-N(4))-methyltransferase RsmH [Clostridiales bacterium]
MVHFSVMLNECMEALNLKSDGIYFDGTFGGAGHSYEILKRTAPNGRLVATDLDDYAIKRGTERLSEFDGRFTVIKDNFKNFDVIKEKLNINGFDGILLDLGVSSFQLDDRERGFSYMSKEEKLDMRMNRDQKLSAETVVNEYSESELIKLLFEYGEEKFAKNIVKNIIVRRKEKRIETCGELVEIIENSIPKKFQKEGHPAKKTFQAIRIEVNGELLELEETVVKMGRALNKNGRMAVLTFHSLEDRLVKNAFRYLECDCICDKSLPICVCDKRKEVNIITKHPITASEEELALNSRSKSAKLRIIEKI